MNIRKQNLKNLLRSDQHKLFKFSPTGIILHFNLASASHSRYASIINLNDLPLYDRIDLLEDLLEHELTINQRIDIKDVLKEFKGQL